MKAFLIAYALFLSSLWTLRLSEAFAGPKGTRRHRTLLYAENKDADTIRKQDIVACMVQETGLSKKDCEACLDVALEKVVKEIATGNKVNIAGFGTFKRNDRKERKGRNPKTGEEIMIAAKKSPSFTAGKAFKDRVNGE